MDLALDTKISNLLHQAEAETKMVEQLKDQSRAAVTSADTFRKLQPVIAFHTGRAARFRAEATAALASRK